VPGHLANTASSLYARNLYAFVESNYPPPHRDELLR
jgi:NAD/NADP transhydrogenase alpha subunit